MGIFREYFRALALCSSDAVHGSSGHAPWGDLGSEELKSVWREVSRFVEEAVRRWIQPQRLGGTALPWGSDQVPEHIRLEEKKGVGGREGGTCWGRHY